ncbi:2-(3-amino-3-carboxypropyl)histidine synthase subunit 2 [Diachasma alloeum]|uniref:2-(3-amino-3-carboxypropyl)histidine synthase subunit 2 n=1 Tax=Diachasma alloeum TaxID=454923 RepID=UPI000738331A|nr:2-(3-amino-3-carboxypropyl)histidine synthase subunit 2 [Diachasma alloeum]
MTPSESSGCGQLRGDDTSGGSVATEEMLEVEGKYQLDRCVEWITARAADKVCLQFPDSCLQDSARIALRFEELLNKKVYILGDTSCGSCCIDEVAANHINADAIVHFGHACLNPTTRLPVFHILPKKDINISALISQFENSFPDPDEKILLFYDVSHSHQVQGIWESLTKKYKKLVLTTLNSTSNIEFVDTKTSTSPIISGRCWNVENGYKTEEYTAVFIGENNRTLASLAMSIPTKLWYHTSGPEITKFDAVSSPWLKRRRYLVEKLKDAKTVGIVVATLGIKNYLEALSSIKQILKRKKKKSYIFSIGKINPAKLANFPEVDAFVVIACPESDIFDSKDYFKPLLTPFEVELAFNSSRDFSTHYCLDFRQILPGGSNFVEFEASEGPDLSLISNGIRTDEPEVSTETMSALACKDDGTVAIGKAGANFLVNRSWQGLEQRIGEDDVKVAEKGRCGLPVNYENEPIHKT